MSLLPGVPFTETVEGPSLLCLGDFVTAARMRGKARRTRAACCTASAWTMRRRGEMLVELVEDGELPDFTVAYFADNDYRSHEVGPHGALPVDRARRPRARRDVRGRRRHRSRSAATPASSSRRITATARFSRTRTRRRFVSHACSATSGRPTLGTPWRDGDEIMICPNMRAAQIYLREPQAPLLGRIATALLAIRASITPSGARVTRRPRRARLHVASPAGGSSSGAETDGADDRARRVRHVVELARRSRGASTLAVADGRSVVRATTRTRSSASPACSTRPTAASLGDGDSPAASSRCRAARPTSAARRTARCTRSIRSAPVIVGGADAPHAAARHALDRHRAALPAAARPAEPPKDRRRRHAIVLCCTPRVPIVQRPRTWPFQGQNPGSNPGGDASLRSRVRRRLPRRSATGAKAGCPDPSRASAGQATLHAQRPRRQRTQEQLQTRSVSNAKSAIVCVTSTEFQKKASRVQICTTAAHGQTEVFRLCAPQRCGVRSVFSFNFSVQRPTVLTVHACECPQWDSSSGRCIPIHKWAICGDREVAVLLPDQRLLS